MNRAVGSPFLDREYFASEFAGGGLARAEPSVVESPFVDMPSAATPLQRSSGVEGEFFEGETEPLALWGDDYSDEARGRVGGDVEVEEEAGYADDDPTAAEMDGEAGGFHAASNELGAVPPASNEYETVGDFFGAELESEGHASTVEFDAELFQRLIPLGPIVEQAMVAAQIASGKRDVNELTNFVFFLRHPTLKGTRLGKGQDTLVAEWLQIRDAIVKPALARATPLSEGKVAVVVDTPAAQLGEPSEGVSQVALMAAKTWDGPDRPAVWRGRVYGLVVHTTGSGLPSRAKAENVHHTAYAVNHYTKADSHGCHYVVGWRGVAGGELLQIANEREQANGVGVTNRRNPSKDQRRSTEAGRFEADLPPVLLKLWRARWPGNKDSLALLPGTRGANAAHVHCECIPCVYHHQGKLIEDAQPMRSGLRFTKAQHDSVAMLALDVARRNGWPMNERWWRTPRLLGHEDLTPISRCDAKGGWDPGFLREVPYFDWNYVYEEIERLGRSDDARRGVVPSTRQVSNEPYQHLKLGLPRFQLVVRRFARWKHFAGFHGDNRAFSTSSDATYRTGVFVVFDPVAGKIVEGPTGHSTGTKAWGETGQPFTYAAISATLSKLKSAQGSIAFSVEFSGKNPAPTLKTWMSPQLDSSLEFEARLQGDILYVNGRLVGDAFPDAEVFIRDSRRSAHMLLTFSTPHGPTAGPLLRLWGKGTKDLGRFKEGLLLSKRFEFIGSAM